MKKNTSRLTIGLLFIIIGICILWFNEGRTVKQEEAIKEAKSNYIDITNEELNPKYNNKLIATIGEIDLTNSENITDGIFRIKVNSSKMKRIVEIYQWEENCDTDNNCTYEKIWKEELNNSNDFKQKEYINPETKPYESTEIIAQNVKVGALTLNEELIRKLPYNKEVTNYQLTDEYKTEEYKIVNQYITDAENLENPEIGNIRISFRYNISSTVSILAVQTNDTFKEYTAKNKNKIYTIREGRLNGEQLLKELSNENNTLKWILRLIGIIITISGVSGMFSTLKNITTRIPIIGNIIDLTTSIVAITIGGSISLIIILLAWLRYRPIISLILLIIIIFLIISLIILNKKQSKEKKQINYNN